MNTPNKDPLAPFDLSRQPLHRLVAPAKARWFERVRQHRELTPRSKCIAHTVASFLNCVTLDSWPSQITIAESVGICSRKTIQRSFNELETHGFVSVRRFRSLALQNRSSVIFSSVDTDNRGRQSGRSRPAVADESVPQSSIVIPSTSSLTPPTNKSTVTVSGNFEHYTRAIMELKLVELLGGDGYDVLGKLSLLDDRIVERLCRSCFFNKITDLELEAARLAARHVNINIANSNRW